MTHAPAILADGGLWPTVSLVVFFLLFLSIVAYVNSMSWVAAMEPDQRRETLDRVAKLVEQGPESFEIGTRVVIGLAGLA